MSRLVVLLGSFALTFSLLSVTWMVSLGRVSDATPTRTPGSSLHVTPAPMPASSTPKPLSEIATPTAPQVAATSAPSVARPSAADGQTQTVVIGGTGFVESQVPAGGSITPDGDGIVIQTTDSAVDALWVTYRLDVSALPRGSQVINVDARMCGYAAGHFWNIRGPFGSSPSEFEVAQPGADGCWHFANAPATDMSITASTMLKSSLRIKKVEYTVTFAR